MMLMLRIFQGLGLAGAYAREIIGAGAGAKENLWTGNDGKTILETWSYIPGGKKPLGKKTQGLMLVLRIGGKTEEILRTEDKVTELNTQILMQSKSWSWYWHWPRDHLISETTTDDGLEGKPDTREG